MTDSEVIKKVRSGEKDAVGILFERYKAQLYTYAYSQIQNRYTAEDIVQTTFLRVLKSIDKFRDDQNFKGWLFTIARNLVRDHFRSLSVRVKRTRGLDQIKEPSIEDRGADQAIMAKESSKILHQLLNQLDSEKREILTLVKLNEMKYKEVAKITGLKESSLRIIVFRAIKELKSNAIQLNLEHVLS